MEEPWEGWLQAETAGRCVQSEYAHAPSVLVGSSRQASHEASQAYGTWSLEGSGRPVTSVPDDGNGGAPYFMSGAPEISEGWYETLVFPADKSSMHVPFIANSHAIGL